MLTYQTIGPNAAGDFLIGYAAPGAPNVFTATGSASSAQAAKAECDRLNDAQHAPARVTIILDREH